MISSFCKTLSLLAALMAPCCALAGGTEIHNIAERISGTWGSTATDVILGPDARITVDGDWFISASNIYIHPDAIIEGGGVIHLMNPAAYGATAAATTLDGGGVIIGCRLSLENGNTVTLGYLDPAIVYPGAGFGDVHPNGSDNLVMANSLNFGNASAHLVLNASDLIFTSDTAATFTYRDLNTVGYAADPTPPANAYEAYVVTNAATGGVITKLGLSAGSSFNYPVGQSGPLAAPYDYTPAAIKNTGGASRDYSVRVTNYANSSIRELSRPGMDRTWQITADDSVPAQVTLTHNDITGTNIGTDGADFNPAAAYITQSDSAGGWTVLKTLTNGGTPVNVLTGNYTIPRSGGNTRFFSKTSDTIRALPIRLISFDALKTADGTAARLSWETAGEGAGDYYDVLRSNDGRNFFTTVARVPARGISGSGAYACYDKAPMPGDNFYCLKMLQADGHFTLSNVRKLRFDAADFERAVIAPNPVGPESKLIVRVRESQQVLYTIVSASGSVVQGGSINVAAGEAAYSIGNLDLLASGAYIVRLQGTTLTATVQILKPE